MFNPLWGLNVGGETGLNAYSQYFPDLSKNLLFPSKNEGFRKESKNQTFCLNFLEKSVNSNSVSIDFSKLLPFLHVAYS